MEFHDFTTTKLYERDGYSQIEGRSGAGGQGICAEMITRADDPPLLHYTTLNAIISENKRKES